MRDFDAHNITAAVLEQFARTPDPRLARILKSLVVHLHDFIRDVDLDFEEWRAAVDFLTRTGHMCDEHRQEFVLLSDTLGASMLVDALTHRVPAGATQTTVLGPFYVENAPDFEDGADLSDGLGGAPLLVSGSVADADGRPLADALVEIWHSDAEGFYDVQQTVAEKVFSGRGRLRSDADGTFRFWSVMPKWYPIPDDGPVGDMLKATGRHPNRPAHVHFMISAAGYEKLITHVFDAESPYLDSDTVFGVKNSLIAPFTHEIATAELSPRVAAGSVYRALSYRFVLQASALLAVEGERAGRLGE